MVHGRSNACGNGRGDGLVISKDNVFSGQLVAVVELNALAELKSDGLAVRSQFPAFSQARGDSAVGLDFDQAVVQLIAYGEASVLVDFKRVRVLGSEVIAKLMSVLPEGVVVLSLFASGVVVLLSLFASGVVVVVLSLFASDPLPESLHSQ